MIDVSEGLSEFSDPFSPHQTIRFAKEADKFFLFYLFVTLGLASFTMVGQMLVSLFRDSQTAQGFGGLFISMTSLFSGILIRPNNIPSFWTFL